MASLNVYKSLCRVHSFYTHAQSMHITLIPFFFVTWTSPTRPQRFDLCWSRSGVSAHSPPCSSLVTKSTLECFGSACERSTALPRPVTRIHLYSFTHSGWTISCRNAARLSQTHSPSVHPESNLLDQFSQVHQLGWPVSLVLPVYPVFKYVFLAHDTWGLLLQNSSYHPNMPACGVVPF